MPRFLVNTPLENQFLTSAATEIGCKVYLGDLERYPAQVQAYIASANIHLKDGVSKVEALAKDQTRNEVQRHEAAKKVAGNVTAELKRAQSNLRKYSTAALNDATNEINNTFQPDPARAAFDAENMRWIRESMKTVEGMAKVKTAMKNDFNIANVIRNASPYTLDMTPENHSKWSYEAAEIYAPEAWAKASAAVEVGELADKYDKTISKVDYSFYSDIQAGQAASRVEV